MRAYNGKFKKNYLSVDLPNKNLNLEIGCGVGWHPISYSLQNPEKNLIAIEKTKTKFNKFTQRLRSHQKLRNIFAIHADATRWIPENIFDKTVEKIFLLYPNPEPKNPAQRWLRMPFFSVLLDKLIDDGEIVLASNIHSYLDEAIWFAEKEWKLKLISDRNLKRIDKFQPRTHFEKKYLLRGQDCREVIFKKN